MKVEAVGLDGRKNAGLDLELELEMLFAKSIGGAYSPKADPFRSNS